MIVSELRSFAVTFFFASNAQAFQFYGVSHGGVSSTPFVYQRTPSHSSKHIRSHVESSLDSPPEEEAVATTPRTSRYSLGLGKNKPLIPYDDKDELDTEPLATQVETNITYSELLEEVGSAAQNWNFQFGTLQLGPPSAPSSFMEMPSHSSSSPSGVTNPEAKAANNTDGSKSSVPQRRYTVGLNKNHPLSRKVVRQKKKTLVNYGDDRKSKLLSRAVWDAGHYDKKEGGGDINDNDEVQPLELQYKSLASGHDGHSEEPSNLLFNNNALGGSNQLVGYEVQIPESTDDYIYDPDQGIDTVWDVMRYEAYVEAQREPLLVSFLFSTILNHKSLESALAFHLANRLASPAMISTQVMDLCLEAMNNSPDFRRSLRQDMLAVRDRDPACEALPDVFLYFKGFHALQTYRVAHFLFRSGRRLLSSFLQSQMSQVFQIDIHPNATLGEGIMLDHGTGIVIGETAIVGHNCSLLHHVTLGGSGKKGVKRHPTIGNGVLVGAGASVLGNILIGDGSQIGAGTLVVEDVPPHCVVVGVPGKVIGSFMDVNVQPSISMNQTLSETAENIVPFAIDGI
jgi:serine O-acetyltransferase